MSYLKLVWCRKTIKRLPQGWDGSSPRAGAEPPPFAQSRDGQVFVCWHDHVGPCIFAGPLRSFRLWDEEQHC